MTELYYSHWLKKKIHIWKIENYMALGPSYNLPKKNNNNKNKIKNKDKIYLSKRTRFKGYVTKWEGVRHPFHPDIVWSSRLLWSMYPFYACYGWYVEHVNKTKSHKFIYEWILFFVLKKVRSILMIKKIWFWLIKKKIKSVCKNLKKKKKSFWR